MGYKNFTEEQISYILKQYYDKPASALAREFDVSISSITNLWHKFGLKGKTKRTYPIANEYYFADIDTPQKAYFLGFICSDGCVHRYDDGRMPVIRICINRQDEYILSCFAAELGTNKPISRSHGRYSTLEISSTQLANDLELHEVGVRKTWNNCIPSGIPDILMRFFIRGYFDGDGSLSTSYTVGSNTTDMSIAIAGYQHNLEKISGFLESKNIHMSFAEDKREYNDGAGAFGSLCATNKIDKYCFLKYIYDDCDMYCPCLTRKRDLASKFIKTIERNSTNMEKIATTYYTYAVCCVC